MGLKARVALAAFFALLAVMAYPIARNMTHPNRYSEHRSPHPASPHAPARHALSAEQIEAFRRDGLVIFRGLLGPELASKMETAGTDLLEQPVMHCEMTKFTGPPIFHGYERYCGRASLVHDYLRDVVYTSPLTHVAAQLLQAGEEESMRQIADVFMAGGTLPQRWHMDFLAFAQFTESRDQPCGDGLVFWMPLETSYREKNGMLFLNGSSARFREHYADDPVQAYAYSEHTEYVANFPKDFNLVAPKLELGDVVAFDQCTIHTASGEHFGGMRRAYQLRFAKNVDIVKKERRGKSESSLLPGPPLGKHGLAVASPQLWPETLAEEDAVRAAGHVTYSRVEWASQLASNPLFALITSIKHFQATYIGDSGGAVASPFVMKTVGKLFNK